MLPAACSLLLAAQQSQAAFADEAIKLPKGETELYCFICSHQYNFNVLHKGAICAATGPMAINA